MSNEVLSSSEKNNGYTKSESIEKIQVENVGKSDNIRIKKYICDICQKTFTRNFNLKLHKQRHKEVEKGENEIKKTKEENDRKYTQKKKTLTRGSRINRHICDVCGKVFTRNFNLKIHKLRHKNIGKEKNWIKKPKERKYTQKKKTLTGVYKTIGNEMRKAAPVWEKLSSPKRRVIIDEELYKKLEKQTLAYKTNLKQGKNIALILSTCPEILKEALSIPDLRAYKLYLNNTLSKDVEKELKSKSIDKDECIRL